MKAKSGIIALLLSSAMAVTSVSVGIFALSTTEAVAQGKGNGNGGGNARSNRGNNGNGQARGNSSRSVQTTQTDETALVQPTTRGNGNGNGNGGGNGNGNGNRVASAETHTHEHEHGNGNGNGRGAIASQLKNLNAMCASERAFENANPDSNVGRIAAYYKAQDAAEMAAEDLAALDPNSEVDVLTQTEIDDARKFATDEIVRLEGINTHLQNKADAELAISLLDPTSETYDEDLADWTAILNMANDGLVDVTDLDEAQNLLAIEAHQQDLMILDLHQAVIDADADKEEALLVATRGRELSPDALAVFEAGCVRKRGGGDDDGEEVAELDE